MADDLFATAVDESGAPIAQQQPVAQQMAQAPAQQAVQPTEQQYEDIDLFGKDFDPAQFQHIAMDENEPAAVLMEKANTGVSEQELQSPQPQKPDNGQVRYEYWQSQADKERNARLQLEREMAELRALSPYAQIIKERPEILSTLSQGDNGQRTLTPPRPPTKPGNYNGADAFNDPDSASYKYREALDDFNVQNAEFVSSQVSALQQARQQDNERQQALYQQEQAMHGWKKELVAHYGFTPPMSEQFVNEMYNPESLSKDNLVKLFYINHPDLLPNRRNGQQSRQPNVIQQRVMNVAPSIVNAPGGQPVQKSENELFSEGLLSTTRRADY